MRFFCCCCLLMILVGASPLSASEVASYVDRFVDGDRGREIAYQVVYADPPPLSAPVVLISHGGTGSTDGHTRTLQHLSPAYAAAGLVAIHLNHASSVSSGAHRVDRPADVSAVIDAIAAGTLPLPPALQGVLDVERIGHVGHSWGAYTAHAVAGATFTQGTFRDARVRAIVAISPQGPDQFGSFDDGPDANSWRTVAVPAYSLIGEEEQNGTASGRITMRQWRLHPFFRYPATIDHFCSVLPGQDHGQMGNSGSPAVQAYIAENTQRFFSWYLAGAGDRCGIGEAAWFPGTSFTRDLTVAASEPCDTTTGWTHYEWEPSLVFNEQQADGRPLPNNAMNLAEHAGALYAGFATTAETGNYSDNAAHVFRKAGAETEWQLDVTFEPGSSRIGVMASILVQTDVAGEPLVGGSRSLLVAGTNGVSADPAPARIRTRDSAGTWHTAQLGEPESRFFQVRTVIGHRDRTTGADLIVVGASPDPHGLMVGTADDSQPGGIAWHPQPELTDGASKWFGMAVANGRLYASSRHGLYLRQDAGVPSTWIQVVGAEALPLGSGTELRGLTTVPVPAGSDWPEEQMLLATLAGNGIWRVRAGGDHAVERELDLDTHIAAAIGYPTALAEGGFNAAPTINNESGTEHLTLHGMQFVFGTEDATAHAPLDPQAAGSMRDRYAFSSIAHLLQRSEDGRYSPLQRITEAGDPGRELVVARALIPSPFAEESGVVYAAGYNASVVRATTGEQFLGRAWIYRGTPGSALSARRQIRMAAPSGMRWTLVEPADGLVGDPLDGFQTIQVAPTASARISGVSELSN